MACLDRRSPEAMSSSEAISSSEEISTAEAMSSSTLSQDLTLKPSDAVAIALDRSVPPTKFECFQKLFPELRLKIWRHLLPGPRIIQLNYRVYGISGRRYTSRTPVPTILHVCRESRAIGHETYKLGLEQSGSMATIYIDFLRDTLYFGGWGDWSSFGLWTLQDLLQIKQIRYLAIAENIFYEYPSTVVFDRNAALLADMPHVHDFTIIRAPYRNFPRLISHFADAMKEHSHQIRCVLWSRMHHPPNQRLVDVGSVRVGYELARWCWRLNDLDPNMRLPRIMFKVLGPEEDQL